MMLWKEEASQFWREINNWRDIPLKGMMKTVKKNEDANGDYDEDECYE